jgi:dihydrolipoamide dehydrogenase
MLGNSKTVLSMDERGYIKLVSDEITGKIIGAQIICARATDMISEIATAIAHGLTAKDLASVIRPHPTYAEGITETAEDIFGMAIHLAPGKGRKK